jgi:hypothetical protein
MLFWGRAMNLFWSLATGFLVFLWSRKLFGNLGALFSLTLFCFSPTFLAHGPLATSDMAMAFFFLACTGAYWRHLQDKRPSSLALSSLLFGLACVTKSSAVLLFPIYALLAIACFLDSGRLRSPKLDFRRLLLSSAVHAGAAISIIWLFYGFHHSPASASLPCFEDYYRSWTSVRETLGALGDFLWKVTQWHLLPDPFVYGFAHVLSLAQQRGAFLNGETSLTGWVLFFPYAFLAKTSLAVLAASLLGAALALYAWLRGTQTLPPAAKLALLFRRARPFLPLAVLFGVYWVFSLTSHLNIGHRHILPTYPPLFIALGGLGAFCAGLPLRRFSSRLIPCALLAVLLFCQISESLSIRPHYLAFFNTLAGGPSQGYRHLVDSSLDWGQDLPGLAHWLEQRGLNQDSSPVYLAYFGTDDPASYGIHASALPWIPADRSEAPWKPLRAGVYCISATLLQHGYSPLRGPWTLSCEREYQDLRALEPGFYAFDRAHRGSKRTSLSAEERGNEAKWFETWKRFNLLRFARLCHYLRVRQPDDNVGYSILIYRLTDAETAAALDGPYSAWQSLIEQTSGPRP